MKRHVFREIAATAALMISIGYQTKMKLPALAAAASAQQPAAATAASNSSTEPAKTGSTQPHVRTAFYRADAKPTAIPRVLLSKGDVAACKVRVGDAMPAIELPKLAGNDKTKLADLFGTKATVVVFWKADRRMTQQQLADIGADVVEPFGKQGVAVVGVAVDESAEIAEATLKKSGATFPNLHDADGKAFALVGSGRFPRTYVLDQSGKIVWFDIEYSLATRRELHQALRAIAGNK